MDHTHPQSYVCVPNHLAAFTLERAQPFAIVATHKAECGVLYAQMQKKGDCAYHCCGGCQRCRLALKVSAHKAGRRELNARNHRRGPGRDCAPLLLPLLALPASLFRAGASAPVSASGSSTDSGSWMIGLRKPCDARNPEPVPDSAPAAAPPPGHAQPHQGLSAQSYFNVVLIVTSNKGTPASGTSDRTALQGA